MSTHEPAEGDAVTEFLEAAQEFIEDFNIAAITMGNVDLEVFGESRVTELQNMCPYYGREVCVGGNALMPTIEADHEDDAGSLSFSVAVLKRDEEEGWEYGYTPALYGMHQGLTVSAHEGEFGHEYRLRHVVFIARVVESLGKATRMRTDYLRGYFEMDSTVVLVDDVESALFPIADPDEWEPPEDTVKLIKDYSSMAVQLLGSREFRRLPAAEQQSMLRALIFEAEDRSRLHDKAVNITFSEAESSSGRHQLVQTVPETDKPKTRNGRYLYVPGISEGIPVLRRRNDVPKVMGGLCVGIECVELTVPRPIRSRKDLLDKRAGLCLVLDPDHQTTEALGLDQKRLVYVPISGQLFSAEFQD